MLAISGLNITIVAGGFFMVFLMAGIPRRAVAGLTIAVVIVYVILSGAGIPVRRAGLMAVTVLIALIRGRRPVSLNVFCAAFFLMLLAAPEDLWNIGFQLSFLSVLSLIALMPLFPDRRFFSLGGSLAVTVGTFPLVLYYFNVVSPIGILANILAIPLFDAALFLSFFSLPVHDIPVIGGCLTHVSSLLVTAGLAWIEWLAGWPFGYWYLQRPTIFRLAVYYGTLTAMVAALRFRSIHRQWIIPGCWIALGATAACIVWSPVSPGFRATVLATGRDPVVHVRFSNGANWLINAGRSFPSDQGERVILPYLRRCGIRSLDGVVLTGLLKRYRGGLPSIFRDVAVREVLVPADERLPPDMERYLKMIRRFVTGSEIVSGHETMKVFRDGAGDWKVLITVGRKSIALRRSVNDVSAGPETDVAVIPYLRKTADLNEAVRSTTFILAGGEASAIRFLTGSVRNVYRLDVTGALEIRPSTKGFTVFSCARA